MRTNIFRFFAAVAIIFWSVIAVANDAVVTASIESQGGSHWLVFDVKNKSTSAKKTIAARLPWGHQDSLFLFAIPQGRVSLPSSPRMIEIPSNTEVVVSPGKAITGRVNLQYRFGDAIDKALQEGPVLLVWACYSPFDASAYYSGHVVIPRK